MLRQQFINSYYWTLHVFCEVAYRTDCLNFALEINAEPDYAFDINTVL